mgnify:CR=1 FL=1
MIRQYLIVELANTLLTLTNLNSFLLFFFIQRYDFIPERSNGTALFVQPQKIQFSKLIFDISYFLGDLHAA